MGVSPGDMAGRRSKGPTAAAGGEKRKAVAAQPVAAAEVEDEGEDEGEGDAKWEEEEQEQEQEEEEEEEEEEAEPEESGEEEQIKTDDEEEEEERGEDQEEDKEAVDTAQAGKRKSGAPSAKSAATTAAMQDPRPSKRLRAATSSVMTPTASASERDAVTPSLPAAARLPAPVALAGGGGGGFALLGSIIRRPADAGAPAGRRGVAEAAAPAPLDHHRQDTLPARPPIATVNTAGVLSAVASSGPGFALLGSTVRRPATSAADTGTTANSSVTPSKMAATAAAAAAAKLRNLVAKVDCTGAGAGFSLLGSSVGAAATAARSTVNAKSAAADDGGAAATPEPRSSQGNSNGPLAGPSGGRRRVTFTEPSTAGSAVEVEASLAPAEGLVPASAEPRRGWHVEGEMIGLR